MINHPLSCSIFGLASSSEQIKGDVSRTELAYKLCYDAAQEWLGPEAYVGRYENVLHWNESDVVRFPLSDWLVSKHPNNRVDIELASWRGFGPIGPHPDGHLFVIMSGFPSVTAALRNHLFRTAPSHGFLRRDLEINLSALAERVPRNLVREVQFSVDSTIVTITSVDEDAHLPLNSDLISFSCVIGGIILKVFSDLTIEIEEPLPDHEITLSSVTHSLNSFAQNAIPYLSEFPLAARLYA